MCALALAQPAILTRAAITEREVIAIIDCSASMRASTDGQTRFQRAVNEVDALSGEVFNAGGYVSIFLASNVPSVIAQRATAESRGSVESSLESLRTEDSCSYGSADIDAAMALCEETISDNANAEIYLYTDTEYSYVPSGVTVVNVAEEGEWNAGILNAYTILEDNYYTLYVEVACYGQDREFDVQVSVQGVNAAESEEGVENNVSLETSVFCSGDQSILLVFRNQMLFPAEVRAKISKLFLWLVQIAFILTKESSLLFPDCSILFRRQYVCCLWGRERTCGYSVL